MVGADDELQSFLVHHGVITPRSEYIKRALNKHWQGGKEIIVSLTKEDPDTFSLYLELVYRGRLSLGRQTGTMEDEANMVAQNYLVLADIYILADFLVDPCTKNTIVDTMLAQARVNRVSYSWSGYYHLPGKEVINTLYATTMQNDGVRKLLVELYDANEIELADVEKWEDVSPEFVDEWRKLRRAKGYKMLARTRHTRHFELTRYHDTPGDRADRVDEDSERGDKEEDGEEEEEDSNEDRDMEYEDRDDGDYLD
jgi:hypothetical protein